MGILGALGPASKNGLGPNERTLADLLKALGYRTEQPYRVLSREVSQQWNWDTAQGGGGLGLALSSLQNTLLAHPDTKVLIVNGQKIRLTQERDQVLADAHAEADRILREADAQAAGRLSDHTLVRSAEARAADIEERAMRRSEEVHREAEAYAYRVLEKLREQIGQITQTVDRGLDELSSRTHASPGT